MQSIQIVLAPHVLVPFAEHIECVPQNFVVLEFRLRPVRSAFLDFKRLAISQVVAKSVDRLSEDAVGFALIHFVRTDLIDQVVEHIAQMHGVEHAEAEINGELQSRLARGGLDAIAVFEQQDAEAIEARILQREAIFSFVHAEAAGTARTCSKEDVIVQNLLTRKAFFLQELQILHQIADREIRRIALAVVPEFLARLEGGDVGHRQLLAAVSTSLEHRADQVLVLPCKAAKQNGDLAALVGGKGPLDRAVEVGGLVKSGNLAQAHAFSFQALLDFRVIFNLDEIRRHDFLLWMLNLAMFVGWGLPTDMAEAERDYCSRWC